MLTCVTSLTNRLNCGNSFGQLTSTDLVSAKGKTKSVD